MVSNDWIATTPTTTAAPHKPKVNSAFEELLQQMLRMHEKKQKDYASSSDPYSNFKEAAAFAGCSVDTVFAVLIGIKGARLKELLTSGKQPNNESIQDTRLDMAVYAALQASYNLPEVEKKFPQSISKVDPSICAFCGGTDRPHWSYCTRPKP